MSLHAKFYLRRSSLFGLQKVTGMALATALLLFLVAWSVALAQVAPPPPAASNETVSTTEDTTVIITTDVPVPAGNWYYVVVTNSPAHGTATGETPVIGDNYKLSYTPGSNQTSPVSFLYQICTQPIFIFVGQQQVCGTQATITVNPITPVNDAPMAVADQASTFRNVAKDIDVLANDNGGPLLPNGAKSEPLDTVTLTGIATPPTNGTATIVGDKIRYTPNLDFCDALNTPAPDDSFTYTVRDSAGLLANATVSVTVACGNALITVGDPYPGDGNHTFLVDITLQSEGMDVAAVDFFVTFGDLNTSPNPTCLIDPDGTTPQLLANNVTNMPLAVNGFISQVTDITNRDADPHSDALRFSIAGIGNPNSNPPVPPTLLTGPSINTPSRRLATIKFKVNGPGCNLPNPTAFLDLAELQNNTPEDRGFTGPNGQNINGDVVDRTLNLATVNRTPTDILLSNNVVREGVSSAFVGFLSTLDPDTGDTFTYRVVSEVDQANNPTNFFRIRFGNELAVRPFCPLAVPCGTPPPSGQYTVVIESADSFGAVRQKPFTIFVTNVNQAPVANDDDLSSQFTVRGRTTIAYRPTLSANDHDPDGIGLPNNGCPGCSIQSVTNGAHGTVTTDGVNIVYTPTDPAFVNANDTFLYTITDNDPSGALTDQAQVTVHVDADLNNSGNPVVRGDCNKDGVISAGDLVATARELFDDPAGNNWYDIPLGNYNWSAYGCNSKIDMFINVLDLTCTASRIFNNNYVCPQALVAASSPMTANLAVSAGLTAAPGATVQVPVNLNSSGHAVAAAAFAVNFDAATFSFDTTDSDGNGVPDAVNLNAPGNAFVMATYNATASRIEIVITGMSDPMPQLSDGAIATVTLTVNSGATISESAVTLTESSLGDAQAQAIPVTVTDGAIQIANPSANRVLLPLVAR